MNFSLPYDWTYLALRVAFIVLLYLFLWKVVKITAREMIEAGERGSAKRTKSEAKLIVLDPAQSVLAPGFTIPLTRKTTIGRHPDCSVVIDEPFLSAFHAEFTKRGGEWSLNDLDSTNGVFKNGEAVAGATRILPGDIVQLGRIKLKFVA
jgi:pSer/pThr/pTyr-binding forkhead associated (FHA) protein